MMQRRPGRGSPGLRHIYPITRRDDLPTAVIQDSGPEIRPREHADRHGVVEARTPTRTTVEPPVVGGHPFIAGAWRGDHGAGVDPGPTHHTPSRHDLR